MATGSASLRPPDSEQQAEEGPARLRSDWRPGALFVVTVAVQWLVTASVARNAAHTGWPFGNDDHPFAVVAAAHDVAHGTIPPAAGPLHPLLLAPLARATTELNSAARIVIAVQVLLLAPIASYCVLELGRRIAGRLRNAEGRGLVGDDPDAGAGGRRHGVPVGQQLRVSRGRHRQRAAATFCTDGVRGHLTVAAHSKPGDVYVYGQGENISMQDWVDLIIRIGEENGYWPAGRSVTTTPKRYRPGASDVMALRVGHEKITRETGWMPEVSWEEGVLQTIRWYAENRERWIGRVDWVVAPSR